MNRPELDGEQLSAWFVAVPVPSGVDAWRTKAGAAAGPRIQPSAPRRRRLLGLAPLPALLVGATATAAMAAAAIVAVNHHVAPPRPRPQPSPAAHAAPPAAASAIPSAAPSPAPVRPTVAPSTVAPHPAPSVPPPTPSPTPVPPIAAPAWPGATNTGVPPGAVLASSTGDYTVTTPGATVSNLRISGLLTVDADNVTIKDVQVTNGGYWVVHLDPGHGGLTIEDSDLSGGAQWGVMDEGTSMTVLRTNIHGVSEGMQLNDNTVAADNYIHDLQPGSSDNGMYSDGVTGVTVRHNTVLAGTTGNGAFDIFCASGPSTNVLVDDNLLAGGGWTIRAGQCAGASDLRFTGNHVSRMFFPKGGYYGPDTSYDPGEPGNVWSGNVWDGTTTAFGP